MLNISELMAFLVKNEAEHRCKAAALAADMRGDEANFEKIRANVFGVFKAVLETAVKLHGDSPEVEGFFTRKLREIPGAWRATLAAAGDSGSALAEKLKLESVAEIEKLLKGEVK